MGVANTDAKAIYDQLSAEDKLRIDSDVLHQVVEMTRTSVNGERDEKRATSDAQKSAAKLGVATDVDYLRGITIANYANLGGGTTADNVHKGLEASHVAIDELVRDGLQPTDVPVQAIVAARTLKAAR